MFEDDWIGEERWGDSPRLLLRGYMRPPERSVSGKVDASAFAVIKEGGVFEARVRLDLQLGLGLGLGLVEAWVRLDLG